MRFIPALHNLCNQDINFSIFLNRFHHEVHYFPQVRVGTLHKLYDLGDPITALWGLNRYIELHIS